VTAASIAYVVTHHDRVVSREYDTFTEAELFRLFDTPGTDDYAVRVVRRPSVPTTPTPQTGA
jgi:hypothetical protein